MSKPVVTFAFHPGVSRERQDEILSEIGSWDEVDQAGQVNPESPIESFTRMCFAYLKDDADADEISHRLSSLPEIESASAPAPRRLI
ncbi:MAG: hypothetical protein AB7U82_15680 [Blastocatellales bacterium]